MTDNNNALVMAWFQQQQTPAGWFDLLLIMVDGMVNNAGELESQPFLRQMGEALADEHPLPESETLGELEANMNAQLSRFQWGVVSVEVSDDGLRLRHQALPMSRDEECVLCHTRGALFPLATGTGRRGARGVTARAAVFGL